MVIFHFTGAFWSSIWFSVLTLCFELNIMLLTLFYCFYWSWMYSFILLTLFIHVSFWTLIIFFSSTLQEITGRYLFWLLNMGHPFELLYLLMCCYFFSYHLVFQWEVCTLLEVEINSFTACKFLVQAFRSRRREVNKFSMYYSFTLFQNQITGNGGIGS